MKFVLVDRILDMEPGKSIRAEKYIAPEEDYFQDHFPGFPVVPGVLLTEMMAQTAGKCLDAEDSNRGKAMLARITSANFRNWVQPGQTAEIHAEILKSRQQFGTANCRLFISGKMVCESELFFSFVLMEKFAPGYRDRVLEEYLSRFPSAKTS